MKTAKQKTSGWMETAHASFVSQVSSDKLVTTDCSATERFIIRHKLYAEKKKVNKKKYMEWLAASGRFDKTSGEEGQMKNADFTQEPRFQIRCKLTTFLQLSAFISI